MIRIKSGELKNRYYIILIIILIISLIYAFRLIELQIVKGGEYREQSQGRVYKTMSVKAPRGDILDRYGRPLATTKTGFSIQIQKTEMPSAEFNEIILNILNILEKNGDINLEVYNDSFPISYPPFEFKFTDDEEKSSLDKEHDWKSSVKLNVDMSAADVINEYGIRYGIPEIWSEFEIRKVIGTRYEMTKKDFSLNNPYTIATDIGMNTVMLLEEQHLLFPGVNIIQDPIREYVNNELGAHILGRIALISPDEYQSLKNEGYGINDMLGKEGIEKNLESYLKGVDGHRVVEQNVSGKVTRIINITPPSPGHNVILTIDSELQRVAEESLVRNIERIRQEGLADRKKEGADANSGAVVAIDVNTAEILAMATYPTYNPSKYNEDYSKLINDPSKPLFNRAISGSYAPGSTFKMLTAIAALEEGIIAPEDRIRDGGIYSFYPGYQPRCWIHAPQYGYQTHGYVNVSQAIKVSCNYFFYDIGRRLTIQKLVKYGEKFGLNEPTGIEIEGERAGILAGPDTKKQVMNEQWYPGDTLQSAIGQHINEFTPIQLANYISILVNGGNRFKPHLLKRVRSYEDGSIEKDIKPELINKVDLNPDNVYAVLEGMRGVTVETGTASHAFRDFPTTVAGKTGTAQISSGSSNGLFIGFAPYEKPQIAVVVVIEHGKSGSNTAPVARDVMEAYLKTKEYPDNIALKNTLIK